MNNIPEKTIFETSTSFIQTIEQARSANTAKTYQNGISLFLEVLEENDIDPKSLPITKLSEESIIWFINSLKEYAATTERLYLTAVAQFFEYLSGENLKEINLSRIRLLIRQRARKPGQRLPQFPKNAIIEVLQFADSLASQPYENEREHLINFRDRAFLITLGDTGLRVHEACNLRRGDIDWFEGRAVIIGKGNREAVVRFSSKSQNCIKDYLKLRAALDGSSGKPLSALPLFARHDLGAGKKIKRITTTTGRNIVAERVKQVLGPEAAGTITPHSFRHFFVTTVLNASGNLKLAQALARHQNIAVTTRYAHLSDDELDKGYFEIFEDN